MKKITEDKDAKDFVIRYGAESCFTGEYTGADPNFGAHKRAAKGFETRALAEAEMAKWPQAARVACSVEARGPWGFGMFTPEQRAEMARKGGRAAHERGTAHRWSPEEARAAGSRGGHAVHAKKRAASGEP